MSDERSPLPTADPHDPGVISEVYRLAAIRSRKFGIADNEDIAQTALAKLLQIKKSGNLDKIANPEAYIQTIIRSAITDRFHRDHTAVNVSLDDATAGLDLVSPAPGPDDIVIVRESTFALRKLIADFEDGDRAILTLLVVFDCNQKEIAQMLNLDHALVRQRTVRLREKLRRKILLLLEERS